MTSGGEAHRNGQPPPLPGGLDGPAQPLGEQLGDGQPQAGGALTGFHGVEAVEELGGGYRVQGAGGVGEGDGPRLVQGQGEIPIAVL